MSARKLGHTAMPRGKRVLVILRDGTRFEDRFLDRTGRDVTFADRGRVRKADLAKMSILRRG